MLEKHIEAKLRDKAKQLGGRAYKFVSPGNNGVPDRIVILPEGKIGFAELKRPKGKARVLQERQIERLKKLGCYVMIVDTEDKADEFLGGLENQ